jgi:hypothetical protein
MGQATPVVKKQHILRVALVISGLLQLPLVAMVFSDEISSGSGSLCAIDTYLLMGGTYCAAF